MYVDDEYIFDEENTLWTVYLRLLSLNETTE